MQRTRPPVADAVTAVVVGLLAVAEVAGSDGATRGLALAALMAVPLAWRSVASLPVAVVVVGALAAFTSGGGETSDYVFVLVALALAMYSLAAHSQARSAVAGLLAALALAALAVRAGSGEHADDYLFAALVLVAPWVAGRVARRRQAATAAAEQRAELAVAEERARIARELHDVVAHAVGIIVVQAGAAEQVIDRDPGAARQALATIRATGKEALGDLRHMLGLLRADATAGGGAAEPQPGLDELDALLTRVRDAGLPVRLEIEGDRRPVGAGVGLAAYRVVQEALTNALRHARGSTATVRLSYQPRALELIVTDSGGGLNGTPGTGHGLIGMRERVLVHDGELDAGPLPGGGFCVRARLPLP